MYGVYCMVYAAMITLEYFAQYRSAVIGSDECKVLTQMPGKNIFPASALPENVLLINIEVSAYGCDYPIYLFVIYF
jgi:hypothetical protein